jgi:protein-disulfide isomerase
MRRLALLALGLALLLAYAAQRSSAADEPGMVQLELQQLEYSLGRPDAPLTVVEYTDYQCPYCRRFEAETFPRLKHDWIDTGRLRFIVRDLPLEIHSQARFAAEAAHCAGAQGGFWPMHDALLKKDAQLSEQQVEALATAQGLDAARLRECVTSARYEPAIARNAAEAARLGINGTPSFIVGRTTPRELHGVRLSGALPYQDFNALLMRIGAVL